MSLSHSYKSHFWLTNICCFVSQTIIFNHLINHAYLCTYMKSIVYTYVCIIVCVYITAAEYANLPLIPPFLQPGFHYYCDGVNFASAGAGALVETFQGSVCVYIFICFTMYNIIYIYTEARYNYSPG